MDMQGIHQRLAAVRSRVYRLFFLEGFARIVTLAGMATVILFLLDYFLGLPPFVRLTLLGIALAYLGFNAYRHLYYPLSRTITEDDVAVVIEHRFPQLQERLISSLQLSRDLEKIKDPAVRPSDALVQALERETAEMTQNLDFQQAIFAQNLQKALGYAFLFMVAIGGSAFAFPDEATIFMKRALGMNVAWPAKTFIALVEPQALTKSPARTVTVAYGKILEIRAQAFGVVPDELRINYREKIEGGANNAEWDWNEMRREGETGVFVFTTKALRSSIEFYIEGGDGRAPAGAETFTVHVDFPPKLDMDSVRVFYDYPAYTGKEDTPQERPDRNYNLKAIEGTTVTFKARADMDLSSAVMELYADKFATAPSETIAFEVSGRDITGTIKITNSRKYLLVLAKGEGASEISNRDSSPAKGDIEMDPDTAPAFTVDFPSTREIRVTKNARLPFRTTVKDDYGVAVIAQTGEIVEEEGKNPTPLARYEYQPAKNTIDNSGNTVVVGENSADYGNGAVKISSNHVLRIKPLNLKEGAKLKIQIEALDFKDGAPNVGKTDFYRVDIVSEEDIREEVTRRLKELIRLLEGTRRSQQHLISQVNPFAEKIKSGSALGEDAKRELKTHKTSQFKILNELAAESVKLQQIVDIFEMNDIVDAEQESLKLPNRMLRLLASQVAGEAQSHLETAIAEETADPQQTGLNNSLQKMGFIDEQLGAIIKLLNKYTDINELIQAFKRLEAIQNKINDELKRKAEQK